MCLVDLFPFAVDAECFRQRFDAHVAGVKEELVSYLSGRRQGCSIGRFLHNQLWQRRSLVFIVW